MAKICTKCFEEKDEKDFYSGKSYSKGISAACKTCIRQGIRIYKKENKDKIRKLPKTNRKYKKEHSEEEWTEHLKELRRGKSKRRQERQKERLDSDPLYKLKRNLRNRVWSMMKGAKTKSTQQLLGASFEDVKYHIESTFTEGMSWENYGEWHVDHKIPLASGNTKEEIEKLFHYSNLQALWAFDNVSKKDKIVLKT